MIKLLKNAAVYAPKSLGNMDILIAGDKIAKIAPHIKGFDGLDDVETVDLDGATAVPGLIDMHVHITGGGGELGPASRVPELMPSQLTRHGITTVLGLLGTDGLTRSQEALVSKARALTEEGVTALCLTGAYRYPSPSLTGDIAKDIAFIDPVIGVKVALADHRGSNLTADELARLAGDARLGGILSGKAGIVVAHMGSGDEGMEAILAVSQRWQIPVTTIIPTHCERNSTLTAQAAVYTGRGGFADFTADPGSGGMGTAASIAKALEQGASPGGIILSTDSGGSLPEFDSCGRCTGMDVGTPNGLLAELRRLTHGLGMALEDALPFVTLNPACAMGIGGRKGKLCAGADADILVLGKGLAVDALYSRGRLMVKGGKPVKLGLFEKA